MQISAYLIGETLHRNKKYTYRGFPGGAVVESLPANAGDTGSSPGLGRSHMLRAAKKKKKKVFKKTKLTNSDKD